MIHDTNLARQYPGIFVYGGGEGVSLVEGNRIWNAGEGTQVVSEAIIRNNVIFDCTVSGITAAGHAAVSHMRNVRIVNNTIVNHSVGVWIRRANAVGTVFSNNAVYCAGFTAIDASGTDLHPFRANYVSGRLAGASIDGNRFHDGGDGSDVFVCPEDHDYRLKGGSILAGRADPDYAPRVDVSGTVREPPFDVGAHEQGNGKKPEREE